MAKSEAVVQWSGKMFYLALAMYCTWKLTQDPVLTTFLPIGAALTVSSMQLTPQRPAKKGVRSHVIGGDKLSGPILWGLKAQGHIPVIHQMLCEGRDWSAIAKKINWDERTAETAYFQYLIDEVDACLRLYGDRFPPELGEQIAATSTRHFLEIRRDSPDHCCQITLPHPAFSKQAQAVDDSYGPGSGCDAPVRPRDLSAAEVYP